MNRISNIVQKFRTYGLIMTLGLIQRKFVRRRIRNYKLYQDLFCNKSGIEVGGPSAFFLNEVPIYNIIKSLDCINFSLSTVWEGELLEGGNLKYGKDKTGYQFICDAVNLDRIKSGKYDFVLS